MSFPTNLDSFVTPDNTKYQDDPLYTETAIIWALNTAVTALETKVGITWSADTSSLDYKTSRLTTKGDILTHDWTNPIRLPVGTNGYMVVADNTQATGLNYIAPTSWGTVTSASVVSANWLAWTIANPTTTPALTLSTTVTWVLKGNGTAISAATAWTDYLTPTWNWSLLTWVLPVWMVSPYAWSSAPTWWLIADWTAVSRTTYSALFAIVSTTYWAWDGTTTFNIPNLKGKIPVWYNSAETEFDALWETWWAKTHTLNSSEIPAHSHWVLTYSGGGPDSWSVALNSWVYIPSSTYTQYSSNWVYPIIQTIWWWGAHNNIQPYITLNYIIKY